MRDGSFSLDVFDFVGSRVIEIRLRNPRNVYPTDGSVQSMKIGRDSTIKSPPALPVHPFISNSRETMRLLSRALRFPAARDDALRATLCTAILIE